MKTSTVTRGGWTSIDALHPRVQLEKEGYFAKVDDHIVLSLYAAEYSTSQLQEESK
jgi:hypothetical protein